ncbi:E3 ubiquitin-protein ligase TRIM22-like [Mytilus edulis]|uniref:E3 ubiquitin-protein ligase TRIM22-like n=1 Tax=Mytilus edulis TaxID=6550 RepID=UPI0039EF2D43
MLQSVLSYFRFKNKETDCYKSVCGICDLRNLPKPSVVWCSECYEHLCKTCVDHHKFSRATKNHKTITNVEYNKLSPFTKNIRPFCEEHEDKYQMYCQNHESPCCRKCLLKDHRNCKDIHPLENIVQNVKSSSAFEDLEKSLEEMMKNITQIQENRLRYLFSIQKSKVDIENEIHHIRLQINKHLDQVQNKLIMQLNTEEDKVAEEIETFTESLKGKEKEIGELLTNVQHIKTCASDLQVFLSMKQIEKTVVPCEQYIQSLFKDRTLEQTIISCSINNKIKKISTRIQSFGKINISKKECNISLVNEREKQAQIMVDVSIDNCTLKLIQKMNNFGSKVTGCTILPSGKKLFCNFSPARLILVNIDGLIEKTISLETMSAFDVTHLDQDTVAVTSPVDSCITIVDLCRQDAIRTFKTHESCFGITLHDGHLVFCALNKGLQKLDLQNDNAITNVVTFNCSDESYVTSWHDQLYLADAKMKAVVCYNTSGEFKWKFELEETILGGISVDCHGNVMVASRNTSYIILISPKEAQYRHVLGWDDIQDSPLAIDYDKHTKSLLISCISGSAFLFIVEKNKCS